MNTGVLRLETVQVLAFDQAVLVLAQVLSWVLEWWHMLAIWVRTNLTLNSASPALITTKEINSLKSL